MIKKNLFYAHYVLKHEYTKKIMLLAKGQLILMFMNTEQYPGVIYSE